MSARDEAIAASYLRRCAVRPRVRPRVTILALTLLAGIALLGALLWGWME